MEIAEIIEAAKRGAGVESDYAFAQKLKVSRAAVSQWKDGKHLPNAVTCEKLAVFSGFPLHVVLGTVGEARAISADEKKVWRKLAAALFVSMLVVPTASARPTNGSSIPTNGSSVCTLCEFQWQRGCRPPTALNHHPAAFDCFIASPRVARGVVAGLRRRLDVLAGTGKSAL